MKNEDHNDFLEFLTSRESPPAQLKAQTQRDIILSLNRNNILFKFLSFQLLGALITLSFCPQFGIGFSEGHGIAHYFRMLGDSACAAFCGSLFILAGNLTAFLAMESDEVFWIWKHFKTSLVLLPAALWTTLMLLNVSLGREAESVRFHLTWIISAVFVQQILFYFKAKIYSGILKKA